MIAPPPWMWLVGPDPTPEFRLKPFVRAIVRAARDAGFACDYAGIAAGSEVYLVSSGDDVGRLVVERSRGTADLWPTPADPNGMPIAWTRFEPSTSDGSTESAAMLRKQWQAGRA